MAVGPRQLKPSMLILLCVSSASWADPGDDMLPPPPVPQSVNDEAVFQLALIVNHYDTGLVVPVTRRQALVSGLPLPWPLVVPPRSLQPPVAAGLMWRSRPALPRT